MTTTLSVTTDTIDGAAPAAPSNSTGLHFEMSDRCSCLSCQAEIPRENIAANIVNQREIAPTRQCVRAWCDHCSTLFELTRELRGGVWQISGGVAVVNDPAKRKAFLARIAHNRGVIQVNKAAS
jgi:hypothetical protein